MADKEDHTNTESFLRIWLGIVALTFVCCVISRAPTLIDKFSVVGFSLLLNVGHVVVFGPFVIAVLVLWRSWSASRLPRSAAASGWPWLLVFLIPAIGIAFLLVQFVVEMVPADTSCERFEHTRFLWDLSLLDLNGIKPRYCFGVEPENQTRMPYIYPPVQSWVVALLALLAAWSGVRIWRRWTEPQGVA